MQSNKGLQTSVSKNPITKHGTSQLSPQICTGNRKFKRPSAKNQTSLFLVGKIWF